MLLTKSGQQPLHGTTQSVVLAGIHRGEGHRLGTGGLDVPPDRRLDELAQVTLIVNVDQLRETQELGDPECRSTCTCPSRTSDRQSP